MSHQIHYLTLLNARDSPDNCSHFLSKYFGCSGSVQAHFIPLGFARLCPRAAAPLIQDDVRLALFVAKPLIINDTGQKLAMCHLTFVELT